MKGLEEQPACIDSAMRNCRGGKVFPSCQDGVVSGQYKSGDGDAAVGTLGMYGVPCMYLQIYFVGSSDQTTRRQKTPKV